MLRTASSLPLTGLLTLGSDPARFQTEPPACYRASWQLPGPDLHRQATTSLRTARSAAKSQRHLPFCWAHERPGCRRSANSLGGRSRNSAPGPCVDRVAGYLLSSMAGPEMAGAAWLGKTLIGG